MQEIASFAGRIAAYADEAPGRGLYAIIDLARLDEPHDWLHRLKRMQGTCNLFMGQPEVPAETLAPWLLPIPSDRREILLRSVLSLELATRAVASWLVTDLPTNELTRCLSRRMTASLDGTDALFRFYDPRLLPVIETHLPDDEAERFFALGSGCWLMIDEHDDLVRIELRQGDDAFCPPLQVPVHLSQALQAASEKTQITEMLLRRWPDEWSDWSEHRRHAYARELILESRQRGIDGFSRRAKYCRGKLARESLLTDKDRRG